MNDMQIRYTQAKVIGGGSSINAQIYTRGNALDYDDWRQMGCTGWGYEDVLPYFRKAEDNDTLRQPLSRQGRPARRSASPRAAADLRGLFRGRRGNRHPAQPRFRRAQTQDGVGYYQLTQRTVRRSSTVDRLSEARAEAQEPDREDRRAGSAHRHRKGPGGRRRDRAARAIFRAAREVILSSGAIGSPRLLQLSGIGPADHLQRRRHPGGSRPPGVGANLQDHLDLFVIAECTGAHTYDRYAKPHCPRWRACNTS